MLVQLYTARVQRVPSCSTRKLYEFIILLRSYINNFAWHVQIKKKKSKQLFA